MRTFFSILLLALCNYTFAQTYKDALIDDLRGNVKSCTYYDKNDMFSDDFEKGRTIEFKKNGQLNNSAQYKRDTKNRIKEIRIATEHIYGGKYISLMCYEYNDNGYIKNETMWEVSLDGTKKEATSRYDYYYDAKGYVSKIISKDLSGSGRIDLVTEYKYISFDKKGNWIEREYTDPVTLGICTEKRIIEYY